MSVFSSIGNFFSNLKDKIVNLFSSLIAKFKEFIEEAFPVVKQVVIAQLKDIALQAVTKLATTDLTNEEKRLQAFNEIKEYAISHSIEVGDSLIFTVIEIAYQIFKNNENE